MPDENSWTFALAVSGAFTIGLIVLAFLTIRRLFRGASQVRGSFPLWEGSTVIGTVQPFRSETGMTMFRLVDPVCEQNVFISPTSAYDYLIGTRGCGTEKTVSVE